MRPSPLSLTPSAVSRLADVLSARLEGFVLPHLRPGFRSAVEIRLLDALVDQTLDTLVDQDQGRDHDHDPGELRGGRAIPPPRPLPPPILPSPSSGTLEELALTLTSILWGRLRPVAQNPSTLSRVLEILEDHRHHIELDLYAFLSAGFHLKGEEEEDPQEGDPDQDQDAEEEDQDADPGPSEGELLASRFLSAYPSPPLHTAGSGDRPARRTFRSLEEWKRHARAIGRAIRTRKVLPFPLTRTRTGGTGTTTGTRGKGRGR